MSWDYWNARWEPNIRYNGITWLMLRDKKEYLNYKRRTARANSE